jgi:hypothetical protein
MFSFTWDDNSLKLLIYIFCYVTTEDSYPPHFLFVVDTLLYFVIYLSEYLV